MYYYVADNKKFNNNIDWQSVIKKEARGSSDDIDLGEVQDVKDEYIITQRGLMDKEQFYVPKSKVEDFDGSVLRFAISDEEEVLSYLSNEQKFEGYPSFKSSDMSKEVQSTIPLVSEHLDVSKKTLEDSVTITKEPVRETKTVEVQLTHEEITIERRPVDRTRDIDTSATTIREGPVESRTEIEIPLKYEEPVITKTPYVKEELVIKKKPVTETKIIKEEITSEKRYDTSSSETS